MPSRTDPAQDEAAAEDQAWAGDPLAQHFAAAWRNTVAAFTAERQRYGAIAEVDAVFRKLIENLDAGPERLAGSLLVRTHASFLAAAGLALSGQVAEAYALLRQSLQASLQGLFVAGNAERQRLWTNRNDDAEARLHMAAAFTNEAMLARLREVDAATADVYAKLDERTLDRAAHPNTYVSSASAGQSRGSDFTRRDSVRDEDVQRSCLRSTAQVGICCLCIFFYVFGDQYRELELEAPLTKLRHGH